MSVKIRKDGAWVTIGGDKGNKGEPGEKGEKGFGDKGDVGNKGEKGIGEKGDIGNKGDKGDAIKGNKGDQGNDGDSGDKGDKGDPGSKGDKGDVEAKGNKGDKGEIGEKGDNKGSKGEPGTDGDKGDKGDVEAKGNKGEPGDKGDKGDFKGSKGDQGEKGDVLAKGVKGDPGSKGDKGDVLAKGVKGDQGQKGQKGEFKGQKGEPGQKGAVDEKGNKGEPGTGGVTINNDVNDYVLTATGNPSVIQAESRLRFDPTGRMDIYAGTGDTHIEMGHGANNQYAYLDLIGDTHYTDFGTRILRGNGGRNTFSQIVHRGTGDLQLYCQEGGGCSITSNDLRLRNNFRPGAGPNNQSQSGGANSGMRFLTNFFSGWAYNQSAYSIDSGINVNQGDATGGIIVIWHHSASYTQHSRRMYFINCCYGAPAPASQQNTIDVTIFASTTGSIGGTTFGAAGFGVSAQGTLLLTGSAGSNYFHLIAVGNVMV